MSASILFCFMILLFVILALVLCIGIHEAGHYVPAWSFGLKPSLTILWNATSWLPFKYPSFKVLHATASDFQQRIISIAGFGAEIAVVLPLIMLNVNMMFIYAYLFCLILHFVSYPFRKKGRAENDFNGVDADEDPHS